MKILYAFTAFFLGSGSSAIAAQQAAPPALDPETARTLSRRINELLREELTLNWYSAVVNLERGGFHQNFARNWSRRADDSVFVVYQARVLWTAAAYAAFDTEQRERFSGYARHGSEFLDRVVRDPEGGFHWTLASDGRIDPERGAEKHLYGLAFVIYAGSVANRLTGDETALKVARDAFNWVDTHAHDHVHGGYWEALRRDGTPITYWDPTEPIARRLDRVGVYYGFKSMNAHIHMLEALTELSKVDTRTVVRERLREVFGIVRDRIAVEPGALNLYFTPDWRAVPAHDSFGHDVETAYLLVEAAEALGDPENDRTWDVARKLVDHALDWGWDDHHGGFYDKGEAFGGPAFDTDKVWWVQAEGLNALLMMHRRFGRETDRYARAFLKQWSFIERHMLDPEQGGWFEETTREGVLKGDGTKAQPWKANYHTARAQMNVVRWLNEIAKRGE